MSKLAIENPHTIRIYPDRDHPSEPLYSEGKGANSYYVTGLPSRCDCIILTSQRKPNIQVRGEEDDPNYIFISTRYVRKGIEFFCESFLSNIKSSFILITGSEDKTIPNQLDHRWPSIREREKSYINEILNHPQLVHWFSENLDDGSHSKMSPIPTGFVFRPPDRPHRIEIPEAKPLSERKTKALCGHYIRNDKQHDTRRKVNELCRSEWSSWTTLVEDIVPIEEYFKLIQSHTFVLCVHGGGLDPSPKAFHTLLNGSIPIIRESALKPAYEEFPVFFVSEWRSENLSEKKLKTFQRSISAKYERSSFKKDVYKKLELDYWWDMIVNKYESETNGDDL